MEIWRKILTKNYLLLRPEFLMIGKSKESKESNSYYLDCFEKESQKGIGTLDLAWSVLHGVDWPFRTTAIK